MTYIIFLRFLLPYWSPRVIVCKDFDVIVTGSSMQKRRTLIEASRIEKAPEISGVLGRILSKKCSTLSVLFNNMMCLIGFCFRCW